MFDINSFIHMEKIILVGLGIEDPRILSFLIIDTQIVMQ